MDRTLIDYFRCLEDLPEFELPGEVSGTAGYFHLGPELTCFGRVYGASAAPSASARLPELSGNIQARGGKLILPFDVSEVIDNLRRERYVAGAPVGRRNSLLRGPVRTAYYLIREFLPVSVRKRVQKLSLSGWDRTTFPAWPVDCSADKLLEQLLRMALEASGLDRLPFIWFWPDGKLSAAIMTHDVETASGLQFCDALMDLDDSFGVKSSFEIIPQERYSVSLEALARIRGRGFEINVHDLNHDGHLYSNRRLFLERADKINQSLADFGASGFRSGALYRNTDWYDAFSFSYDMSVPSVGNLDPQPGGCCTVMPYFIGRILELPLTTIQDYSLFHILEDYSTNLWKRQIELIRECHGLASFIIHPDYILEQRAQETYRQLLSHLASLRAEQDVWMALPGEVNLWWRDRNQMCLAKKDGHWEVEGPGHERARVAYAVSDGGRLAYRFD